MERKSDIRRKLRYLIELEKEEPNVYRGKYIQKYKEKLKC